MSDQLIDSPEDQYLAPLTLHDAGLTDAESRDTVRDWCDSYAGRLAERYLSGDVNWTHADYAANRLYDLMIRHSGGRVPDYAWDVYLAFDGGEIDGLWGQWTREKMRAVQRKFGLG